jgi:8-oxo-dGTP pyrophosphatase MutT (NUDIX family)
MNKNKDRTQGQLQYAAMPYRFANDRLEVMLVTSRETKRWIIPKGWPMKDCKPHAAAKREAFEEAGVIGEIGKRAIGTYAYAKRLEGNETVRCTVKVFPLEVRKESKRWPERGERKARWFSPEEAAEAVDEQALGDLLRRLESLVTPPAATAA